MSGENTEDREVVSTRKGEEVDISDMVSVGEVGKYDILDALSDDFKKLDMKHLLDSYEEDGDCGMCGSELGTWDEWTIEMFIVPEDKVEDLGESIIAVEFCESCMVKRNVVDAL